MSRHPVALIAGITLTLAPVLTACSSQPVAVDKLYQSGHCNQQQQALRLISDSAELEQLVRQPLQGASAVPEVDFDSHWIVLAAWGTQPNAGYRVTLVDDQARQEGDILQLPIAFEAPQPGTMQAQVMTAPCLVVAVPKDGYQRLEADSLGIDL